MGRTRRKTVRRQRAKPGQDERFAATYAALWDPNPCAFLGVVSSFVGFDESSGLELPPMHLKLADMASDPSDLDNALLVGLSHLAPHADDRVHAGSLALAMSRDHRTRLPSWLAELHNATATAAARLSSDGCDRHLWLLEVRVAGRPLTAMLAVDDELGLPGEVAGTVSDTVERLTSIARHPSAGEAMAVDVPPAEAGDRILGALARADDLAVAPRVPYWPEPRALLRWLAEVGTRT